MAEMISFRVDPEFAKILRWHAANNDLSVSDFIRNALEREVQNSSLPPPPSWRPRQK